MRESQKIAVITGGTGGIGMEITRAVLRAGYRVIMACRNIEKGNEKKEILIREENVSGEQVEVIELEMSSLSSVASFAGQLLERQEPISLLMNNSGVISRCFQQTGEGMEQTVCVNYIAPYLLTRKLLPLMDRGSRIVNMVSCTYPVGSLKFPDFFTRGRCGSFWRLLVYSNTKLALLLFTLSLAEKVREKGILVNAADPGIVSTNMISMNRWIDPLSDLFFRPFIRSPRQGASTAVSALLDDRWKETTGSLFASTKPKRLRPLYYNHPQADALWDQTGELLKHWL